MEVDGKRQETNVSTEVCEPCLTESNYKPADGFCTDCEECMCQKCFRDHLKAKSYRHHVFGSLQEESSKGKQETEKCKKHTTENIKYFCQAHYSVACGDCLVSEHQKCEPEFIKDIAKNFEESTEFMTFLEQIQKWETDTDETKNCININRKVNKLCMDNAIKSMVNFRKDISDFLDKILEDLHTEVRKVYDDNETEMSKLEDTINNVSKEINRIKEELNSNVYGAENVFFRKIGCKDDMDNVEKTVFDIQSKSKIKVYTFEPETQVKEIITSMKLGFIKVTISGTRRSESGRGSSQTKGGRTETGGEPREATRGFGGSGGGPLGASSGFGGWEGGPLGTSGGFWGIRGRTIGNEQTILGMGGKTVGN